MKTLTELSGTQIRMAAKAVAEARRSLPAEKPAKPAPVEPETTIAAAPADDAPPVVEGAPIEAASDAGAEAGAEVAPAGSEALPEGEGALEGEATAPVKAAAKPADAGEPEAVKAALDEAVSKATGISGDRLTMLRAAVEVTSGRTEDVRLVRVFTVDEEVSGAKTRAGYQFLVDFLPRSMKQVVNTRDDRGGKGGGHGGKGGGGGGGGGRGPGGAGGGDRGAKGITTGGFSMDSLRDDRKGGGGGGGRGRPGGGGKPGGGGPKR